jgi:hypothetical protein
MKYRAILVGLYGVYFLMRVVVWAALILACKSTRIFLGLGTPKKKKIKFNPFEALLI